VDVYHPYLRGASILRPDLAEAHHLHPLVSWELRVESW
jgi:hypothetical protein